MEEEIIEFSTIEVYSRNRKKWLQADIIVHDMDRHLILLSYGHSFKWVKTHSKHLRPKKKKKINF